MTKTKEGDRRRRATRATAIVACVLFAAGAGAGCRAPAKIELESRSASLSLAPATPSTLPSPATLAPVLAPALPPRVLALPPALICDQAMALGGRDDACGAVSNWIGETLIRTSTATYCHFSWVGTDVPDFSALNATGRTVERDCPVVGLAAVAPTLDPGLLTDLAATFRDQTQGPAPRWQPHQPGGGEIRVVAVDSAVKAYDALDDETFGHGRLVGRTIADLACPQDPLRSSPGPDSCTLAIKNVLAVPRAPNFARPAGVVDTINGGYFGTRGELGHAISIALGDWEMGRMPNDRLILNLSLGWEAILPIATASGVANDAIATLLERASCLGALSIAAAGNQAGPGSSSGPFLPASWESVAAPGVNGCQSLWPAMTVDPSAAKQRPLVYAVAAVDDQDRPLMTTRLGNAPRLVATGIAAVTSDARGPHNTLVLSGSSIAAAVVSGVAAAVWESDGALSGPEVMNLIYGSGVDLGLGSINPPTALCLNPPCDRQHRVSLCAALTNVNALVGLPPPASCPVIPAGAGAPPAGPPGQPSVSWIPTPCAGCASGTPPPPEQPWVWPQPSGAACPSCLFLHPACSNLGFGVVGQIDPGFVTSINNAVYNFNNRPGAAAAPQAHVNSVAARLVADAVTTDFSLGSTLSTTTFWLQQTTGANRATISFSIALSGVPGVNMLTTSPQDIPVICQ